MRIRLYIFTAILFAIFTSGAFAAKLDINKRKSIKLGDHHNHFQLNGKKQIIEGASVLAFDANDELEELLKTHHENPNSFLQLCKKDDKDHHKDDDGEDDDKNDVNEVPLPPALWLFGSGFIGLIKIRRKKD